MACPTNTFWKYTLCNFVVILQILHMTFAGKYTDLPGRPLPLSLKPSEVNFDHVSLSNDVTIIAYHDIVDSIDGNSNGSDSDVTLQNFVDQMTYLEVNGYHTISATELFAYLTSNVVLPSRSILLTFQGGKKGVWNYAYPILREKKFYATIFVSPDHILQQSEGSSGQYMTLNQLKVMDNEPLFEIYPTGKSGKSLTENGITKETMIEELGASRLWLEEHLEGSRPYFAWPQGAYNRASLRQGKQFYNLSFALDELHGPQIKVQQRIPRFVPKGNQDLPTFLRALEGQQVNLEQYVDPKPLSNCFDLEVEVQGQIVQESVKNGFVPCNDVMFRANRIVTSEQMVAMCVNIKKGLGLEGKDLQTSDDVKPSNDLVTRADVVVSLYHCAKEAWLDFDQELPKVEIMNPFSDIDGSAYGGIVVALAGLCDVAAPPNDRGTAFHPDDWSSRGNAVVASWRMLNCVRDLISPDGEGQFPNEFPNEDGVWKWLPSDSLPKAKDSANIAVAGSANPVYSKFEVMTSVVIMSIALSLINASY